MVNSVLSRKAVLHFQSTDTALHLIQSSKQDSCKNYQVCQCYLFLSSAVHVSSNRVEHNHMYDALTAILHNIEETEVVTPER